MSEVRPWFWSGNDLTIYTMCVFYTKLEVLALIRNSLHCVEKHALNGGISKL
jgi:hypothetical protein